MANGNYLDLDFNGGPAEELATNVDGITINVKGSPPTGVGQVLKITSLNPLSAEFVDATDAGTVMLDGDVIGTADDTLVIKLHLSESGSYSFNGDFEEGQLLSIGPGHTIIPVDMPSLPDGDLYLGGDANGPYGSNTVTGLTSGGHTYPINPDWEVNASGVLQLQDGGVSTVSLENLAASLGVGSGGSGSGYLPDYDGGTITSSRSVEMGFSYDIEASPSGRFITFELNYPDDIGREIGIRVMGVGNITLDVPVGSNMVGPDGSTTSSVVISGAHGPRLVFRASDNGEGGATFKNMGLWPIETPASVTPGNLAVWGDSSGLTLEDGGVPGSGDGGGGDGGDGGDGGSSTSNTMSVSAQSWFHVQKDSVTFGDESLTWTGDYAMITVPPINWSTAYGGTSGAGSLATNIWRSEFLALVSSFNGPWRFMDWNSTNYNPSVNWADRTLPTASQYEQYGAPDSSGDAPSIENKGMAYEWQIDLCNRTMRDFWVCIPHQATDAYVTALATLIQDHLHPSLKVYVELSNEVWNFGLSISSSPPYTSFTGGNHRAQNDHSIMQGVAQGLPGSNIYYKGGAWYCKRSYEMWYLFGQVFGDFDRIVRTLCINGNNDLLRQGLITTYSSGTYNPHSMQCDLICSAPYIEGQTLAAWKASVDDAVSPSGNMGEIAGIAAARGIPRIGCYEGGIQAAGSGCDTWAVSPDIIPAYTYLYDKIADLGSTFANPPVFVHYTLAGKRSPTAAWGLLDNTYEAHTTSSDTGKRYYATMKWIEEHP